MRVGVARGAHDGDEHLGATYLPGCPADHLHGVAGKVDEHPLAGRVHLAQRRLQPTDPFAVEIAEPELAEAVLGAGPGAVFLP
jgi:hypothetical protein